jgi:3-deoxy-D-manno-octulosonic-acid transferase
MDILDASCLTASALAGALGRGVARGLPAAVRARLGAEAPPDLAPGWVWLHAASVGELLLCPGILGKLREGGRRVHITTGTAAGLELLASRLPSWGGRGPAPDSRGASGSAPASWGASGSAPDSSWNSGARRVTGGCFPFDDPPGLAGFLDPPPGAFIALETEIWPNLYRELWANGVPICIANGRLTQKTARSPLGPFLRRAASRLSAVAARDPESAELFRAMGAPNVAMCGNLKADLPPPPELHDGWKTLQAAWSGSPVLVAGNTVEGEEEIVFAAWEAARERCPGTKLIVAPRQPRRFEQVAAWLASGAASQGPGASGAAPQGPGASGAAPQGPSGGPTCRRSRSLWGDAERWRGTDILLLDTMGELAAAYRLGHVALVGGGWRAKGGHNPLEPLRWGVPTLIGPGFSNFADIVGPLLESGKAPLRVVGEGDLPAAAAALLAERGPDFGSCDGPRDGPGQGFELPPQLRDTLQKTWDCLGPHVS